MGRVDDDGDLDRSIVGGWDRRKRGSPISEERQPVIMGGTMGGSGKGGREKVRVMERRLLIGVG